MGRPAILANQRQITRRSNAHRSAPIQEGHGWGKAAVAGFLTSLAIVVAYDANRTPTPGEMAAVKNQAESLLQKAAKNGDAQTVCYSVDGKNYVPVSPDKGLDSQWRDLKDALTKVPGNPVVSFHYAYANGQNTFDTASNRTTAYFAGALRNMQMDCSPQ